MRIPRNYGSTLLTGRNRTGSSYSLLQSALSRSSKGKRLSRNAQLLSSLTQKNRNNVYSNTVRGTADTQKLYYNMKYHAGQVGEYGNKLADQGKTSIFAKAKESGSTAEIAANIRGFVSQYNSMLGNLKESGTRADNNYLAQLNNITSLNRSELASCGVTRNTDGTLTVDDKKLAETDLDTLEKVWGGKSGLGSRAALWADSVESTAGRNMEAQTSTATVICSIIMAAVEITLTSLDKVIKYAYPTVCGGVFCCRKGNSSARSAHLQITSLMLS